MKCVEKIIIIYFFYSIGNKISNNLHSIFFRVISDKVSSIVDVGTEDKRGDGTELDEDVDSGTRGILERVTNGITDNSSSVLLLEGANEILQLGNESLLGVRAVSELFLLLVG